MNQITNAITIQDYDLKLATYFVAYENALILDTRTAEEYCKNHICHSIQVPTSLPPLNEQERAQLRLRLLQTIKQVDPSISADRPIIIYCKKGIRARIAKQILKEAGFRKVMSLGGVETEPIKDIITEELTNPFFKICYCEYKCT